HRQTARLEPFGGRGEQRVRRLRVALALVQSEEADVSLVRMELAEARVRERGDRSHDGGAAPSDERLDFGVFVDGILARVQEIAPFPEERGYPMREPPIQREGKTDVLLEVSRGAR